MPHVGGGSNSGGFHSGGSGSSSSSSIPKTDVYGNTHSKYYIKPGYYYHSIYVPYSRVHRGLHAIGGLFVILLVGLLFIGAAVLSIFKTKTDSALEEYSLDRYSDVYTHDKSYECNLLIEIVAYENLKEIDYLPIVGDNVVITIDEMFGNQYTYFGGAFKEELDKTEDKVLNLYSILATSLGKTNDSITQKYYTGNTYASQILNRTTNDLGDTTALEAEIEEFYTLTGYNITIDISTYKSVYHISYPLTIGLFLAGIGIITFGMVMIIKTLRAVKKINEEDKKGNLKEYYEGEVSYEEHIKKYSMDEPYTYNKSEYDDLRKEFEIDKKEYEMNPEDFTKVNEDEE